MALGVLCGWVPAEGLPGQAGGKTQKGCEGEVV